MRPEAEGARGCRLSGGMLILAVMGGVFGLFVLVFMMLMAGLKVVFEVPVHLVFGFFRFLGENLPRISFNAATWVPGLIAFLLAVVVIHSLMRAWARKGARAWTIGSSLALALIVPVLFVIAFLVPGVLLQVQQLSEIPWAEEDRSTKGIEAFGVVESRWAEAIAFASEHDGRFPDALAEMDADKSWRRHRGVPQDDDPIYLGAGFTEASDPRLPLLISPPFPGKDGTQQRFLMTMGGESKTIPAEEVNAWIQRSLEARRVAEK